MEIESLRSWSASACGMNCDINRRAGADLIASSARVRESGLGV
jgi:hypothetical protein